MSIGFGKAEAGFVDVAATGASCPAPMASTLMDSTILRWVLRYAEACEKRWRRFERPVGGSWRADEAFIKVRGLSIPLIRSEQDSGEAGESLAATGIPELGRMCSKVHLQEARD